MRQPCLFVKVIKLGWFLTNALTQSITVSGMVIKSQLLWTIFLTDFNAMNLYPTWILPLRPREIASLVLGDWLLCGLSFSCTWQYCTIYIWRCFLKSKVSHDMMILGLILSDIPTFIRKKFRIFTVLSNIWLVRSFGIFWKLRMWQVALHYSFNTLIHFSMSGMFLLAVAGFNNGSPGRDSISILKGLN